MQEDNLFTIIKGIQTVEKPTEKQLYRLLYKETFMLVTVEGIQKEAAEDLFQEAFFILISRIQLRKIEFSGTDSNALKTRLVAVFTKTLYQRIFSMERSAYHVVEGVRQQAFYAKQQLGEALTTDATRGYVQKLIHQYRLTTITAVDILNDSVAVLLERIGTGHFTLEADAPNTLNKNRLFKYFNEVIRRSVLNWQKKQQTIELSPTEWEQYEGEMEQPWTSEEQPTLFYQVRALLHNLDAAGQFILKETYANNRTPKQIAEIIPNQAYQSTELIVRKKVDSLNKLRNDFTAVIQSLDSQALEKLHWISGFVLNHLIEPCKTILQNAFPPKEKSMDEIAEILQYTRPKAEVDKLQTAEQVKKRKYKCMQLLHEAIWEELLQPQKS